jgi:DNA-binding LacI/PurR family transcriptional regulator
MDDPFFSEILQGIEEGVQASGYSLFIAAARHSPQREQQIFRALAEHRADGVIMCSSSFTAEQGRQLFEYGLPVVVVNNQAVEDYRYSIYHDDMDGCRQVTRHLIGLGHQRIAYLGHELSGRTNQDRLEGYCLEMQAAGLAVLNGYVHQAQGSEPRDGLAAAAHFLGLPKRPTALVCFNDMLAIGALQGVQSAGVQVPAQMSIAGFDNIVFSAFTNPPLTTFDQPKRYIGFEAARLLLGLLDQPTAEAEPRMRILRGTLLLRQSTAAPNA